MDNIFAKPYEGTFDGSIPFSRITVDMYEPAIMAGIEKGLAEIEAIANNPEPPTFDNTIKALDFVGEDLDRVLNAFGPLTSADTNDRMMEIETRISPELARFSMAVILNEKLWERVKTVYEHRQELQLDDEDSMNLEERYHAFASRGAQLKGEKREQLKAIMTELSELTTRFGNNVLLDLNDTKVLVAESEADGIPQEQIDPAREAARAAGDPEGMLRFGLDAPTYMAVMKSADRADVRERFYRAYGGRNIGGEHDNVAILTRIAELRAESARLLGYPDSATFLTERRMAHNPANIYALLDRLRDAYTPALGREMAELEARAGRKLDPWDYSYYADKVRTESYNFDVEALRPYLQLDRVVDSMFALAGNLYGITFTERHDIDRYHDDVRVFEVNDADGSYVGLLYTDFYTRPSKQQGAWMTEFRGQRHDREGRDERPHITIVTNFAPPTAERPTLLRPREVETLLHEFGHALHGLLSRCRTAGLAGTSVRRDFVELPSQMNEGFATNPIFLNRAGAHWQTGEPIPAEMVAAWKRSLTFGAAYQCIRQLYFGYLDMAWHTLADDSAVSEAKADPMAFEDRATAGVTIFPRTDGTAVSPQFSHIFAGGYAAGYYSYKWAEVLAADAFEAMVPPGSDEIDHDAARRFRSEILERGGTIDPAELYRRFRGRDADVAALLRRDGITAD